MRVLTGTVKDGYGVATHKLRRVMRLIERRTGLRPLIHGTFNLGLSMPYIVPADALIERHEYNRRECIKLQRCRVGDVRAIVMRPDSHETGYAHGPAHLELLSTVRLRTHLGVKNGDVVEVELEGDDLWWSPGINDSATAAALDVQNLVSTR